MIKKERQIELFGNVFAGIIDTWESQGFRVNEERDGTILAVEDDKVRLEIWFLWNGIISPNVSLLLVRPKEIASRDSILLSDADKPGALTDGKAIEIGNEVDQILQRALDAAYPGQVVGT